MYKLFLYHFGVHLCVYVGTGPGDSVLSWIRLDSEDSLSCRSSHQQTSLLDARLWPCSSACHRRTEFTRPRCHSLVLWRKHMLTILKSVKC